jgi:hypothetical protein
MIKNVKSVIQSANANFKNYSKAKGLDVESVRKNYAFNVMVRRFASGPHANDLLLKGGFLIEVRFGVNRMTTDVDLSGKFGDKIKDVERKFRRALSSANEDILDLDDYEPFIGFLITDARETIGSGKGVSLTIKTIIGAEEFTRFSVDLCVPDYEYTVTDVTHTGPKSIKNGWAESGRISAVSVENHLADKIHAYARPRENPTRVRDLIDLSLMISEGSYDMEKLSEAVRSIFTAAWSPVPIAALAGIQRPPESWRKPYETMASGVGLSLTIEEAHARVVRLTNAIHEILTKEEG